MGSIRIFAGMGMMAVLAMAAVTTGAEESKNILDREVKDIDGKKVNLAEKYDGKVVLIVNVASKCGYTPQYKDLEELNKKYAEKGLAILGFPCNDFGGQEPGTEAEIKKFCTENFGVEFDMFSKIKVKGDEKEPLYEDLTSKEVNGDFGGEIPWNFNKFLFNRKGKVIARFSHKDKPTDEKMVNAIVGALEDK